MFWENITRNDEFINAFQNKKRGKKMNVIKKRLQKKIAIASPEYLADVYDEIYEMLIEARNNYSSIDFDGYMKEIDELFKNVDKNGDVDECLKVHMEKYPEDYKRISNMLFALKSEIETKINER